MNSLKVGIVGGTRGMGKWFAKLLEAKGYRVYVWGRDNGEGIEATAPSCDVVVVSVPLSVTREVIRKVGPLVRNDGALMDLSSLKTWPVAEMLSSASSEVVGLHPLFGPRVRRLEDKTIVICEGRGKRWKTWIRNFFQGLGAQVVELTPEEHDRAMAVVQALTHLNTMTLGLAIRNWGTCPEVFSRLSTPAFAKKMSMIKKVFQDKSELYCSLVALNPHSREVLKRYLGAIEAIKPHVLAQDIYGLKDLIENSDPCKIA